MDRRSILGVVGGAAAGIAAQAAVSQTEAVAQAPRRGQSRSRSGGGRSHAMQECAEACQRCEEACNEAAHHCFEEASEGESDHLKALHYLIDCQELCSASAKLCARRSPLMAYCCRATMEACEVCIKVCERMDDDDFDDCLEALRKCAESCSQMASGTGRRRE